MQKYCKYNGEIRNTTIGIGSFSLSMQKLDASWQVMKRSVSILIFLSLMLILQAAIATHWQSAAKPVASPSSNSCVRVGKLISVLGRVQLKRQGWLNYYPIDAGAVLCLGDLLHPVKGAKVVVECTHTNQTWILPNGVPSSATIGCDSLDQPIHTITRPIIPTRD